MKHFGDITKISGYDVPLVDIVTGGSPCQDLSVAGRRAGLAGERSGLFVEQIRIIKEMREKSARTDNNIRPRYMVWENVPGAFSSNKGEDFRAVLEETARIADKTASIPRPEGKQWSTSGCIMGNGWSIAWRVHDAQFWGVPQRRKRIALVADFGGQSAPEILFERESVCGDITKSGTAGQGISADAERSANETISFLERAGCQGGVKEYSYSEKEQERYQQSTINRCYNISGNDISGTLDSHYYLGCGARGNNEREVVYCLQGNGIDRADTAGCNGKGWRENECYTLNTIDRPAVWDARDHGNGNIAPTMTGGHNGHISDYTAVLCIGNGQANQTGIHEVAGALNCMHDQQAIMTAVDCRSCTENSRVNGTLQAKENGISLNYNNVCRVNSAVRRLTPLECERLQGYPDHWTDIGEWTDSKGKKHKDADSPRYKALGNSIALPFWQWLSDRICAQYDCETTMASLFDGIGGFPLVFTRAGAKAAWNSEVEPFCEAVTKRHFGDE